MRRIAILVLTLGASVALAACNSATEHPSSASSSTSAPAKPSAPQRVSMSIDHATRGCHVWSTNGGARASVTVRPGGTLSITNNDVMPHLLKPVSAAGVTMTAPNMNHMGAGSTVTFPRAGTYTFTTKAGEDYPSAKGVETVGPDNNLRLTVKVA